MHLLALSIAGAFLANALPHLSAGLQGQPFPSPFAKPPGVGDSTPVVNALWGFLNLLVGLMLLSRHPVEIGLNAGFAAVFLGAVVLGTLMAARFGQVQAAKARR